MKWYGINIGEQDAQTRSYTVTQAIPILIQKEDGKTMRVLRKRIKDGQKSFSFPDWVWKVRR